ncbi:hypothetical protein EYF80_044176 [Liparis tanakae]|uniref:Uncharacterized protein n=1 Tax=Liparis tanakae TaxID=230148 RepID=A0A4Z2FXM4_9TELE|nr:hypothetical protein EYF80_044176 [Liparis tanakae]
MKPWKTITPTVTEGKAASSDWLLGLPHVRPISSCKIIAEKRRRGEEEKRRRGEASRYGRKSSERSGLDENPSLLDADAGGRPDVAGLLVAAQTMTDSLAYFKLRVVSSPRNESKKDQRFNGR